MNSERGGDSSRDVYGVAKMKTKEEIVLPVILMPLKNSPRSLAANKDENFKLAPVQQSSPKNQSINQKLEAFQLALTKDNSPRFL
jgi:ethanolamine utilization protein EutA (predicted chaperonin)